MIIVDNGSTDGSLAEIQSKFPKVHYIQNKENLGFAEGSNVGIRKGLEMGADFFLLLNSDTIVAPNFLKELVNAANNHPEASVFGPKIYYYDEPATIWYAGASVDQKTGRCFHYGCDKPLGYDELKETDFVCGCALAFRKEVIEKVGFLAPEYFLIWEEIDWCYRARKAGFLCLYVPTSRIWHKISASFVGGNRGPIWLYYYFRNRLLFHKRHKIAKRPIPIRELIDLIKTSFSKDPKERACSQAALIGVCDYFLGRLGRKEFSGS